MGKITNKNMSSLHNSSILKRYENDFITKYRKEISPLGHFTIIVFCSLAVFYTTKSYFVDTALIDYESRLSSIEEDYRRKLVLYKKNLDIVSKVPHGSRSQSMEMNNIKRELKSWNEREAQAQSIIDKQRKEIKTLKDKLRIYVSDDIKKTAKVNKKVLFYNNATQKSLLYRHNKILKNLKRLQEEKKDIFVQHHDTSAPNFKIIFKEFVDNQEIEYIDLKNELYEKRILFRKQKFINLADNN